MVAVEPVGSVGDGGAGPCSMLLRWLWVGVLLTKCRLIWRRRRAWGKAGIPMLMLVMGRLMEARLRSVVEVMELGIVVGSEAFKGIL
jgi:hypothetical protein